MIVRGEQSKLAAQDFEGFGGSNLPVEFDACPGRIMGQGCWVTGWGTVDKSAENGCLLARSF